MSRITFNSVVYNYLMSNIPNSKLNEGKENGSNDIRNDEICISEESKKLYLNLQKYDINSPVKFNEQFPYGDYCQQRKLEFAARILERQDIEPLENQFQIQGVEYTFKPETLEQFIYEKLEGKAKNASLLAYEIANKIRGTVNNASATIEERAVNRKIALKFSEFIAQNYFNNANEADSFLSEIIRSAENDVLREKGYVVFDNTNIKPFKKYTLPTAPDDYISVSLLAEKYGDTSLKDILSDQIKLEDFIKALNNNSGKWKEEILKRFEENEKQVQDIIDRSNPSPLDEEYMRNIINTFFE